MKTIITWLLIIAAFFVSTGQNKQYQVADTLWVELQKKTFTDTIYLTNDSNRINIQLELRKGTLYWDDEPWGFDIKSFKVFRETKKIITVTNTEPVASTDEGYQGVSPGMRHHKYRPAANQSIPTNASDYEIRQTYYWDYRLGRYVKLNVIAPKSMGVKGKLIKTKK